MILGTTDIPTALDQPFNLPKRHTAIFGQSGTGKSTLLKNIVLSEIDRRGGVSLLDPHGDLTEQIIECLPRRRTQEVIVFDPSDEKPIGINPLAFKAQTDLAVSDFVGSINATSQESWGPRLESILTHATYAVLESIPSPSVLDLPRFLADRKLRQKLVPKFSEPVRQFFKLYDNEWPERYRVEATAAVMNKIEKFALKKAFRDVLGRERFLEFREVIDTRRILLCRLGKGQLGEDVSSLLGSFILSGLKFAALSRQDIPLEERIAHLIVVDEIQNFTVGMDFSTLLAESRKYGITLIVACQTVDQLEFKTRAAVFGNCPNLISFRVSGEDAERIEREFAGQVSAERLTSLPNFECYAKVAENPGVLHVFPFEALRFYGPRARREKVLNHSRDRYAA
jgi:DNA helicase HerA-like ATPase